MDEMTFQHELRELKQSVTDIANNSQSTPSAAQLSGFVLATALHNDLFVAQLRDVKMRIDAMQAGLPQQWQQSQTPAEQTSDDDRQHCEDMSANSSRVQYDNLTRGFEALDVRVNHLEKIVKNLENTVRESTFTPDASETTADDLEISEAHPAHAEDALSSDTTLEGIPERRLDHGTPTTLSQALHALQQDSAIQSIQFTQQKDDGSGNNAVSSELLSNTGSANSPDMFWPDQRFVDTHAVSPVSRSAGDGPFEPIRPESHVWGGTASDRSDVTKLVKTIEQMHIASEERDQEIQDLKRAMKKKDSSIKQFQQSLQMFEAARAEREALIQSNKELREANSKTVRRLSNDLKECEASRQHFMTKYVDENYRFKWLEQSKLQSEHHLKQKLSEYERALQYSERHNEVQMKHALRSRDEELDKLSAFSRDNEAIIYQQEEIIARGGWILEERDAEIDRLYQDLEDCQKEKRGLQDRASKLKGILRDRDEEIKDLKCDVKDERVKRGRLEDLMRKDADAMKSKPKDVRFNTDERQIAEPIVRAAEAVTGGRGRSLKSSWSPQPIRGGRVLPHEESRRRLWEDGDVALSKPRFGSASPIAERKSTPIQHNAVDGRHVYDRNDNPPAPRPNDRHKRQQDAHGTDVSQKMDADRIETHNISGRSSDVNFKGMEAQARTNDGRSENHRHALPLDVTRWPPLPARAAAVEKVGSVPNLRAGVQSAEGHGAISKPASMLDLRAGKKSQTYHAPSVETEAESAAEERSGSSLLD